MPGKSTYEIDEKKLRKKIKETDMNASEHSRAMGYESGFVHNCLARGKMNKIGINYFERIGIPYDSFKPDTMEIPKINTEPKVENAEVVEEIKALRKSIDEINISIRTIGNLLTQINEKVMK